MEFSVKAISGILILLCIGGSLLVLGDMGTAASYDPLYLTSKCNGSDSSGQGKMFAAVNQGLWDDGAACGRRYRLSCVSGPCKDMEVTIEVEVLYFCTRSLCNSTLALHKDAFADVSSSPNATIRIDFTQL
ncbi:hypothetical protein L1049_013703 [Liquidambar formosana]|uniref:Expansin-like EG45 domain-containing protein n=1 Tax=Liquidambar formosana TaxID=63359 RepID=A0AAP0RM87_LIQFO